jgi:uncharacterized OB-fold protein
MALGKCRECGREVSTGAAACPGCGVKNPTASSKRALVLLGVFGVLFVFYRCATRGEKTAATTTAEPLAAAAVRAPEPAAVLGPLTAAALLADYQANEVKADLKYKGKRFHITGTVTGVSSGLMNEPHVHLDREIMGVDVKGLSKERAAALNKGDRFEADCTVTGEVVGSPFVDCS